MMLYDDDDLIYTIITFTISSCTKLLIFMRGHKIGLRDIKK